MYVPSIARKLPHVIYHEWYISIHAWDPEEHFCFINLCNFRTLDRFRHSWQASAVNLWNTLPADILLGGDNYGWHTTLKQAQHHVLFNYVVQVTEVHYSKKLI